MNDEKDNCDHNSEDTVHVCNQLVIYGDDAETQREHDDIAVQKEVVGVEQDSVCVICDPNSDFKI
jgi:hypothetical protein